MNLRTDAARHPSFFLDGTARKWYNDARKPLNQSAAAPVGLFAPAYRLEIRKGFLRAPSLHLEQNPSLAALAIESENPKIKRGER